MVDSCIHDPKIEERTDLLAHFVKTPDEDGNVIELIFIFIFFK